MRRLRAARCIPLPLVLLLLLAGCGSDDDASNSRTPSKATTTTDTASTTPDGDAEKTPDPTPLPEPTPTGEQPPITVAQPATFAVVAKAFVLSGTASVTEAELAWAILGTDLRPLVSGRMSATCGAPCRGKYRTSVSLAKVPLGSYELHVWSPNSSEGGAARLHDTVTPITVAARIDPNAPAPDAAPPTGSSPD